MYLYHQVMCYFERVGVDEKKSKQIEEFRKMVHECQKMGRA